MTPLKMLTGADAHAEIRRLYFGATKATIEADLAKALDLLKAMPDEEARERATVYMEGLAQMRTDWAKERSAKSVGKRPAGAPKRTPAGARTAKSAAGTPTGRRKTAGTRGAASRSAAKKPRTR